MQFSSPPPPTFIVHGKQPRREQPCKRRCDGLQALSSLYNVWEVLFLTFEPNVVYMSCFFHASNDSWVVIHGSYDEVRRMTTGQRRLTPRTKFRKVKITTGQSQLLRPSLEKRQRRLQRSWLSWSRVSRGLFNVWKRSSANVGRYLTDTARGASRYFAV